MFIISQFLWVRSLGVAYLGLPLVAVVQSISCVWLCDPMDCTMPGFPVHHPLLEPAQNSVPLSRWCHPTISSSVVPFSSCLQSFPASGSSLMSWLFASGGESIGASVSAPVLPMISFRMDWFDLLAILGTQESSPAGVGCHVLLQGIFPTQELNPGLPNCWLILYHLSHEGCPNRWLTPVY